MNSFLPIRFRSLASSLALLALTACPAAANELPVPPTYEVGEIPDQRVIYDRAGSSLIFDVVASALGASPTITASYDETRKPDGALTFDTDLDRLSYSPAPTDTEPFEITFLAVGAGAPVVQQMTIEPVQPLPPEYESFGVKPNPGSLPDPESRDYLVVDDRLTGNTLPFNEAEGVETRAVTLVGKVVVFEEGHPNDLHAVYHGLDTLETMEIHAETVIFRSSLHLPQTQLTIRAVDVIFEDSEGAAPVTVSTTPRAPFGGARPNRTADRVQPKAANGRAGGGIDLWAKRLEAPGEGVRFITSGGRGQDARLGQKGADLGVITAIPRKGKIRGVNYDLGTNYALFFWVNIDVWPDTYEPSKSKYEGSVDWGSRLRDSNGKSTPNNATPGGKPGDGGAGGHVRASLPIGHLIESVGGVAGDRAPTAAGGKGVRVRPNGVKNSSQDRAEGFRIKREFTATVKLKRESQKRFTSPNGSSAPGPEPDVPVGAAGEFEFLAGDLSWLSASALRVCLNYLNDAYLEGHLDVVDEKAAYYIGLIDEVEATAAWVTLDTERRADLEQIRDDLRTLLHRIASNLDFFGNPAGWVPMLSFEVNKNNFDNEIERALRVMYLNYWLGDRARQLEDRKNAMLEMREELMDQVAEDREAFSEAVETIPTVEAAAESVQTDIDVMLGRIQAIEDELLPKAKNIVALRKTARTMGKVAQTIPVYQPALGAAGGALEASADIDPNKSWEENALVVGEGTAGGFSQGQALKKGLDAEASMQGLNTEEAEAAQNEAAAEALKQARGPLIALMQDTYNTMTSEKGADPEVQAELDRLLAEVPEYKVLKKDLDELNAKKREFIGQLSELLQSVTVLPIAISRNLRTVALLNRQIQENAQKLNPETVAYLHDMDRRARARLLKYHYYVARAYAYRRLEAYPGQLDLNKVFAKFEELADNGSTERLNADEFLSLKAVYEEQISSVGEAILDAANQSPSEQSITALLPLPQDIIDRLNAGEKPRINLKDFNLFPISEENLRITELKFKTMEVDYDRAAPRPSSVDLVVQHSGVSELQKDGRAFLFRHDGSKTRSLIQWKTRYHFATNELDPFYKPTSDASKSLINALVPNTDNLLIYSRPAVFADLMLDLDDSATPGARAILKSAILQVNYDFTQRNQAFKSLKIAGGDNDFDVQIGLDREDRNGRQAGRGDFERTFDVNDRVILTAPASVGDLAFVRWEGEGIGEASNPVQTVTMADHFNLRPIYEPTTRYQLTVIGGEGSGTYFAGDVARVQATPPAGQRFLGWQGGDAEDPQSVTTTVPMLGDVTVTALFSDGEGGGNPGGREAQAMLAMEPLSADQWRISLQAESEGVWRLESSRDLRQWVTEDSITVVGGRGQVTVNRENGPRFYRAAK